LLKKLSPQSQKFEGISIIFILHRFLPFPTNSTNSRSQKLYLAFRNVSDVWHPQTIPIPQSIVVILVLTCLPDLASSIAIQTVHFDTLNDSNLVILTGITDHITASPKAFKFLFQFTEFVHIRANLSLWHH
jgi:hypothetical protein